MACLPPRPLFACYQALASHVQSVLNRPVRPVAAADAVRFGHRIPQVAYERVLAHAPSGMDIYPEPKRRALMLSSARPAGI
jgi:hypothetical protein